MMLMIDLSKYSTASPLILAGIFHKQMVIIHPLWM
jgi:Fic family protein